MMVDRRVPHLPLLGGVNPLERDLLKIRKRSGHRRLPDRETEIHRVQTGRPFLHAVYGQGRDARLLQTLQDSKACAELRAAIGIAPLERLGDARRQFGAADTGPGVEDLPDLVDPQGGEPLSKNAGP
ncbi:MAG: hypothetical protein OXC66_10720 [Roseovarius sp.]|nr:hypothetical protein [Roseovarius sp.]